jgi:polyisoprenoid-binding protein YceI
MTKSAIAATLLLGLAFVPASLRAGDGTVRDVDPKASKALFEIGHLYLTQVSGTVPIVSGEVSLPAGSAVPTHVEAVLDPTGIKTGEDERDGELQDADWFDTKRFATWTFASTSVTPGAAGHFTVAGTLTVHGVAEPVELDATVVRGLPAPTYHATGHADRHGFGMTRTRTDALVGNDITLVLDVALRP